MINLEGKTIITPVSNEQVTKEVVTRVISDVSGMEHVHVAPSSKLMLKIEEIHPLDVFYSSQHKAIVKKQRKKIKFESTTATTPGNE